GDVSNVTVTGNTINTAGTSTGTLDSSGPSVHGIKLTDTTGTNIIRGNTLNGEGNGTAIVLSNADNVTVGGYVGGEGNTINTYGRGVFVQGSDNASVIRNSISNILGSTIAADGIHIQGISQNALIDGNTITNV